MYSNGALVTICGRTEEKLKQSVQEIVEKPTRGGAIQYVICDVTDEDQVLKTVLAADDLVRGLTELLQMQEGRSNSSVPHAKGGRVLESLNLNVLGTMLCIKHAVPMLRKSDKASFVGMSSIASHLTHLWFGAYPAAKAGIEAIIRNAADEYGPANIA